MDYIRGARMEHETRRRRSPKVWRSRNSRTLVLFIRLLAGSTAPSSRQCAARHREVCGGAPRR